MVAFSKELPDFEGYQFGAYRCLHRLGEGGGGIVQLAERRNGSVVSQVVLKLYAVPVGNSQRGQEASLACDREYRRLMEMAQKGLADVVLVPLDRDRQRFFVMPTTDPPPVLTYDEQQGSIRYDVDSLILPYADRGTLENAFVDCYDQGRNLPGMIAEFLQLSELIERIHDVDEVHGDLKEGNVFRFSTSNGRTYLRLGDPKTDGGPGGTLKYMSPEAFTSGPSKESDIYAFGATLYQLATGRDAFPREHLQTIVGAPHEIEHLLDANAFFAWREFHAEFRPAPPFELNPYIGMTLCDLILRCLDGDPENRPTARECRQSLERIQRQIQNRQEFAPPAGLENLGPGAPVALGSQSVSPEFIRSMCGLECFLFFVKWKTANDETVKRLIHAVQRILGRSGTIIQIKHNYDFVIRAYSTLGRAHRCIRELHDHTGDKRCVRAMACDRFVRIYQPGNGRKMPPAEFHRALWQLHPLQERGDEESRKWLLKRGILTTGSRPRPNRVNQLHFSSLRLHTENREGEFSLLLDSLRDARATFGGWGVNAYMKRSGGFDTAIEWPDDAILEYVVPSPSDFPLMEQHLLRILQNSPEASMAESKRWHVYSELIELDQLPLDVVPGNGEP